MRRKELSDTDLLALSRTRPTMLGVIYERHAAAVYRYLARRVAMGAAEDLLGEVFVAAVEARLRVRPHDSGSALPWLYGIANNVVRSYRRRSSEQLFVNDADDVTAVDWAAVDERLDAGARRQELRAALMALTEAEREVLLLVAWEGTLGMETTTAQCSASSATSCARAQLRPRCARRCGRSPHGCPA